MAVIGVEVISNQTILSSSTIAKSVELEIQNTAESNSVNNVSQSAVEVVSKTYISNVVVSPTAPAIPYEGQIWIDTS